MSKVVKIIVPCTKCGDVFTLEVLEEDYKEFRKPPQERRLIQDIFPYLTPQERELLISKTCDKCWKDMFGGVQI